MGPYVLPVLLYWALSGFVCAGLFANINESDLNQRPYLGGQTPAVRTGLYFVFGGAILPMVFLIGAAVNGVAVAGSLLEAHHRARTERAPASGAGEEAA